MRYTAVYDRTVFYDPASKYCVLEVRCADPGIPQEARRGRYPDGIPRIIAVGYELPRTSQIRVCLEGEWKNGKYGWQFQVERFQEQIPQTSEGIRGYLSSRLVKGVGPGMAGRIVDRFGADALRVLEQEPERLLEIPGITPDKLKQIQSTYVESRGLRDLMLLLSPYHLTPAAATKIYAHFGASCVELLQNDPYALCQAPGFGFRRVDEIALKNGLPVHSPQRIRGALFAALDKQHDEGDHLYANEESLKKTAATLLNDRQTEPQMCVKPGSIGQILSDMVLRGEVVDSGGKIYPVTAFAREDETARRLAALLCVKPDAPDIEPALEQIRKQLGIRLSRRQWEAVHTAFQSNLSIITGPPGTGKTTILRMILQVFRLLYPKGKRMLAAPTGRASRRMAESTGCKDARTLHSLLGLLGEDGYAGKGQAKPLDADQLQSVGAGDVFRQH